MRRTILITVLLTLIIGITGCGSQGNGSAVVIGGADGPTSIYLTPKAPGESDKVEAPLLKAITVDKNNNALVYYDIFGNGVVKETIPFVPDDAKFLYADTDDFVSDTVNGKIIVELKDTKMSDEQDNEVEADDTVQEMMQKIADETEHDICGFTAIIDNDDYYAFVKHNVNWQDPCILYQYDISSGVFTELCRWDNVDMTGIAKK